MIISDQERAAETTMSPKQNLVEPQKTQSGNRVCSDKPNIKFQMGQTVLCIQGFTEVCYKLFLEIRGSKGEETCGMHLEKIFVALEHQRILWGLNHQLLYILFPLSVTGKQKVAHNYKMKVKQYQVFVVRL